MTGNQRQPVGELLFNLGYRDVENPQEFIKEALEIAAYIRKTRFFDHILKGIKGVEKIPEVLQPENLYLVTESAWNERVHVNLYNELLKHHETTEKLLESNKEIRDEALLTNQKLLNRLKDVKQRIDYLLQISKRAPLCPEEAEEYYLNQLREIRAALEAGP